MYTYKIYDEDEECILKNGDMYSCNDLENIFEDLKKSTTSLTTKEFIFILIKDYGFKYAKPDVYFYVEEGF